MASAVKWGAGKKSKVEMGGSVLSAFVYWAFRCAGLLDWAGE